MFESIARNKIVLKGPTETPFGGDFRVRIERKNDKGVIEARSHPSVTIALRKELGRRYPKHAWPEDPLRP